jgi:hypothetical protein
MGSTSTTTSGIHDLSPPGDAVQRQLQTILASREFSGSRRCQNFLSYVCDKALAGEAPALKERTIAVEVFGRQPDSDLGEDTIVRVGAREVRKRLAQYYVTPEGAVAEVRISLPSGSYVPEFRYAAAAHPEEPPPVAVPDAPVPLHRRPLAWLAAAVPALVLLGMGAQRIVGVNPGSEAFDRFWAPVFQDSNPLLIAVAHPIVYHVSGRAKKLSEDRLPRPDSPLQRAVTLPPNELNGYDIVPVYNQYVGFGDMVSAVEVASLMGRAAKPKSVRIRMASTIEFADLRKTPTLLIGSVTNRWTMEMQQAWRYRFSYLPGTSAVILDSSDTSRQWSVADRDAGSADEDYILVSRIRSKTTGGLLLVAAGLKQFGTEAAGRLLADRDGLDGILRKLPPGWEDRNLQIVLHAMVIRNTPAQPEVVASYVW